MNQINPLKLLQLKASWEQFKVRHPKFLSFLNTVNKDGFAAGDVVEITITNSEGKAISANIKVTEADVRLIGTLKELMETSSADQT